ncbi:SIS domain-containing protein [Tetragenococcus halophilus]|uniref:SIS domain-containing protein n=1 Tax=Tetragenococcus halophilus TaxID=51669 RepID=UPI000CAC2725|nr:SIS domain-containing protein [Tetragenococcus halophilus]GBD63114.1 hypothetical protein TEHD23766T_0541 [Tetragenococcus halophilus subsp. flandriensis]
MTEAVRGIKPKRLIFVASGTSYNAALAVRYFMEKVTHLPVSVVPAYNFTNYESIHESTDLIFAISQEGESTNTIDAITKAQEYHIPVVSVTENLYNKKRNTIAQMGNYVLDILCGKEEVGPKTKGYVATVLTLQMAALEISRKTAQLSEVEYERLKKEARDTVENLPQVIDASIEWFHANERDLAKAESSIVVGYGANFATAIEGGLKALETVRYPFLSFEVEEFLHGPLAMVRSNVYSFFISPESRGYERINPLYTTMQVQNKHCYSIGSQKGAIDDKRILSSEHFMNYEGFTVLEYIVPMQVLAYFMYKAKDQELYIREYPKTKDVLKTKTENFR